MLITFANSNTITFITLPPSCYTAIYSCPSPYCSYLPYIHLHQTTRNNVISLPHPLPLVLHTSGSSQPMPYLFSLCPPTVFRYSVVSESIQVQGHIFISCTIDFVFSNRFSSFGFKELHYIRMTIPFSKARWGIVVSIDNFDWGIFVEE